MYWIFLCHLYFEIDYFIELDILRRAVFSGIGDRWAVVSCQLEGQLRQGLSIALNFSPLYFSPMLSFSSLCAFPYRAVFTTVHFPHCAVLYNYVQQQEERELGVAANERSPPSLLPPSLTSAFPLILDLPLPRTVHCVSTVPICTPHHALSTPPC